MSNLFYSDLFRLRKGAALRNTIIGLIATTIFIGVTFLTLTSEGLVMMLDDIELNASEIEELNLDMDEVREQLGVPENTAEFAREMIGSNVLPFFFLPIFIAIFGADYSCHTYRNTLTYESNRNRVYLAKLLLSAVFCIVLSLITLLCSLVFGGFLFGWGGMTAEFFLQIITTLLLLFPVQMATIAFGHCLLAVTKKTSATIAIYLIGLTVLSSVVQFAALLRPSFQWLQLLDWNSVGAIFVQYWTVPVGQLVIGVAAGILGTVGTTAIGMARFRACDLA